MKSLNVLYRCSAVKSSRPEEVDTIALRVMAIAAPENRKGVLGRRVLNGEDPVSIHNACRCAGILARDGVGAWGDSNWAGSRQDRNKSIMLLHSLEDELSTFEEKLQQDRPNLLLIGTMSISFPGAIACAKRAREVLGDAVYIVLGGRHVSESIYRDESGQVTHHRSSPLSLMANAKIPRVFDLVVSGEGEGIIPWIGEMVDSHDSRKQSFSRITDHLGSVNDVPGRWIIGWVAGEKIRTIVSTGIALERNYLPTPAEVFGVSSAFDVFGGRLTAHVFGDTGSGCVFDCIYCSERRSVTGPMSELDTSVSRLFRQLCTAAQVIEEDSPGFKASVFVEDSTILAGSKPLLGKFVELLEAAQLDLRFGGQFTIDQILQRSKILEDLKRVGLDYLFIGIETFDPEQIGGMSKDTLSSQQSWSERTQQALELLVDLQISCGSAILFGLGESHQNRIRLLAQLGEWKRQYGSPSPVSINWAVQHPLKGDDGGTNYDYVRWGTPTDEWLEAFCDFGEASVLYPVAGQSPPVLSEVNEIMQLYRQLVL